MDPGDEGKKEKEKRLEKIDGKVRQSRVVGAGLYRFVRSGRFACGAKTPVVSATQSGKPQGQGSMAGFAGAEKRERARFIHMEQREITTYEEGFEHGGKRGGQQEKKDTDTVAANCVDQDLTRSVQQSTRKTRTQSYLPSREECATAGLRRHDRRAICRPGSAVLNLSWSRAAGC